MNCFSPLGNFTCIYFLSAPIHVIVPSTNFLCVTTSPRSPHWDLHQRILKHYFFVFGNVLLIAHHDNLQIFVFHKNLTENYIMYTLHNVYVYSSSEFSIYNVRII